MVEPQQSTETPSRNRRPAWEQEIIRDAEKKWFPREIFQGK
jgi:hypothetical protein